MYKRGVTRGQRGDTDGEIADYTAVIELPDAPANVVEVAHTNLIGTAPSR